MAKRKKGSKVHGRAKLRKANSAKRSKAREVVKAAKRAVAKTKPKRAPVKKTARKVEQQPVAPVVETVAVEVVEQPAPGRDSCHESRGDTSSKLNRAHNATKRTPSSLGTWGSHTGT